MVFILCFFFFFYVVVRCALRCGLLVDVCGLLPCIVIRRFFCLFVVLGLFLLVVGVCCCLLCVVRRFGVCWFASGVGCVVCLVCVNSLLTFVVAACGLFGIVSSLLSLCVVVCRLQLLGGCCWWWSLLLFHRCVLLVVGVCCLLWLLLFLHSFCYRSPFFKKKGVCVFLFVCLFVCLIVRLFVVVVVVAACC